MFSPFNDLPKDLFVLVTDEIDASADFVLHQALHSHLKSLPTNLAIILSSSEPLSRWEIIASRVNLNLSSRKSNGSLHFLDIPNFLQDNSLDPHSPSLKPIFDWVVSHLESSKDGQKLVIVDDITILEWTGFGLHVLINLIRALRTICSKYRATFVIRHHILDRSEPDELFRSLLDLCSYHIEVLPLSSGRSGAVNGQIALHPGPSTNSKNVKLFSREHAMHYRLTESNVIFFNRGTAGGML
ncbi:hypothetical protein DL96DRAFT_1460044 [Flagelloscypha sp. PMI_526]|nr:hypothetical protein DL96DRAFT_1460044 [Flagelloscypha sp. PMI_526]